MSQGQAVERSGEFGLFGPPGTGKTTWLAEQINRAVAKFGGENILVASFTKAAAKVLVGRELPIPDQAIGTLHAHCYRALGRPKIADAYLKEFGEAAGMLLTGVAKAPSLEEAQDLPTSTTQDDDSYLQYSRLRNMLVPRDGWPASARNFGRLWEEWKREHEMMDFTDLIERAEKEMLFAPGNARVGFFDECQDSTPLQHKLMRTWGRNMQFFIMAGDDDQCLYSFLGARPETMLGFSEERKLFLRQSWRVPRIVQRYAESIIEKVASRQVKEYLPRDEEGSVEDHHPVGWKKPLQLMADIEADLAAGMTCMIIAPCAYALGPIMKELKNEGIPYGNPLRPNRADWNPLVLSDKRESALGRLRDFLEPKHELRFEGDTAGSRVWSAKQLLAWIKLIDDREFFGKGFKAQLKRVAESGEGDTAEGILELLWHFGQDRDYLSRMVTVVSTGTKGEALALLHANFRPDTKINADKTLYAMHCLKKAGGDCAAVQPKVLIGTIHSVKGGQADSVYVIPDVPENVYRGTLYSREEYDASVRLSYVAVTRAKKKVAILRRETRFTLRGLFS